MTNTEQKTETNTEENTQIKKSNVQIQKIIENWDNLTPEEKLIKLSEPELKKNNKEIIPIVLIDNSGSTSSNINNLTILMQEVKIIKNILMKKEFEKCYVMYWNTTEKHLNDSINVTQLDESLKTLHVNSTGGTDISVGIHNIPQLWYQKKTIIYIVTDGEINGDKYQFNKQIFSLTKRPIEINIITVENNSYNYLETNVSAGSTIYSRIQDNKLSKYIKNFECYNKFHYDEPFINFYNPTIGRDQFSYKEYIFNDIDFNQFVEAICLIINLYQNDKQYLEKVMYNLSFTLYYYTKYKTSRVKNEVIRLFVSLFEEAYEDTEYIKNIFESEIKNHEEGVSKTYCQYKENRKKLFEKTSDELKNDVSNSFAKGNNFMSFIIDTIDENSKVIIQSNNTNCAIRLSDNYYNNAGIIYQNYTVPMLSIETRDHYNANQSLRQWIRAIYSKLHNVQANDERILYLFLTDVMSIVLSDLPDTIKNGYKNCAKIMLDAKRFNSGDLKQITFLTSGNKPKPMVTGYFTMDEILSQCKLHFNKNLEMTNDELWFGICWAYGLKELINVQIPKNYDIDKLIQTLKMHNSIYLHKIVNVQPKIDFKDYITQEDISKVGGYKYPDVKIGKKIFKSDILLSLESYNNLINESQNDTIKHPITGSVLNVSDFIFIDPIKLTNVDKIEDSQNNFKMEIFNSENFQRVDVIKLDKMDLKNLELKSVELFDFESYPYEFFPQIPIITEKLYKEKEQFKTNDKFNNQVKLRFDWLFDVNMSNVVIAGGFTKSIIFDEKVNDIDMYIYGSDDNDVCVEILQRLVNDITKALHKKYNNVVHLVAYKKEFNVYELIYFENINNLQKEQYELQDLIQMKYIIKVQIIMKKHLNQKDIFNTYDIDSCTVLWNGKELFMTERSYISYKYLINIPRIDDFYTDTFDMRLLKYYKSGFRIALPRLTIDEVKLKLNDDNTLVLNKCKFYVNSIENNNIYIERCELLKEKPKLENKSETNETHNKLSLTGVSIYESVIGDIGSLDDSRSIVKFMKYVQRQNRLVDRVKTKLEKNESVNESDLIDQINSEMEEELNKLKFKGKKYVKHEAIIDDDEKELICENIDNKIKEVMVKEGINTNHLTEIKNEVYNILSKNDLNNSSNNNQNTESELKQPEEYIRVYYKVSTPTDIKKINEFDNGTCDLQFIWTYEDYYKQKDWYNSNVEL